MKPIAQGVCSAIEALGPDCKWRAAEAWILALIAIALAVAVALWATRSRGVRRALDGLFTLAGGVAALFLIAMLGIICVQMWQRWTGGVFPGATDYAGYCMAASAFFALAYALNRGAHINVNLFLNALGDKRRWGEIWRLAIASLLATYFARYAIKATFESEKLNDISQGQDATPMWIPQIAMAVGTVLIALALWDNLVKVIVTGETNIRKDSIGAGTE